MNRIFIEAQKETTSECCFLKAILSQYFPDKEVKFICMDGVGNLFNETNVNLMRQAVEDGENILVILDADNPAKGAGCESRTEFVDGKKKSLDLDFPLFLYPNNNDDGDVEILMEDIANKSLHQKWWDCFNDYEACVSGISDNNGDKQYNLPNLKAKLHTYISSQKLSNKERKKLGSGNWLFDNASYWDLSRPALEPLKNFLKDNLK